jgi:hypothetical protein
MEFTRKLVDLSVPEHKLGVFECAVSHSDAQVTWFFNGMQVDTMQTKKRFQILSIGEFRRLAIRNCLIHETNTPVMCKWGELETSAKLFVTDCPFIIKDGLKNKKVPRGVPAILECTITNNLAPAEIKFAWKKNGQPIDLDANQNKYDFTVDGDRYRLTVKDFQEADEAEYEIYMTEPDDFDISSKAKVTLIQDMEEIIEDTTVSHEFMEADQSMDSIEYQMKLKLADVKVRKHQEAAFELKLPAARTKVLWMREGKPISPSDLKYRTESVGKVARLIINDALPEDEGMFTAVVGDMQASAQLAVEDYAEVLTPFKDTTLYEKEELKLTVIISDKNAPGTWFKDGKPLEQSEHIQIEVNLKNCLQKLFFYV